MANAYNSITGTNPNGQWATLAKGAYDRVVEYQLRTMALWRQLVDKHPVQQDTPGTSVKLSILNEFAAAATTPLDEILDPDSVAPPAPTQVTVTLNEYGNWSQQTWRLRELGFTQPNLELANLIAKNQIDTIDSLVHTTVDASTHIVGLNAGVLKSENTAYAQNSVAVTDVATGLWVQACVGQLRKRKSRTRDGINYVAVVHPDVSTDLRAENSASSWVNPHSYVDTSNIYNGEIGVFQGARFIEVPDRVTTATNTVPTTVYTSYFLGAQALAEAVAPDGEPQTVFGTVVDPLQRKFPIGWKALLGWGIYRPESIQLGKTAAKTGAL